MPKRLSRPLDMTEGDMPHPTHMPRISCKGTLRSCVVLRAGNAIGSPPKCGLRLQLRVPPLLLQQARPHNHLGFLSTRTAVSLQRQARAHVVGATQCQLVRGLLSCVRTGQKCNSQLTTDTSLGPEQHLTRWHVYSPLLKAAYPSCHTA